MNYLINTRSNQIVGNWLMFGVGMILFQIVLGGITRLTGSGLSITEWNLILGVVPPLNFEQWMEAFDKYKQISQYELVNVGMTLSEFKWIYFWEYIHRLWGRLLGFVFFIPLVFFVVKNYIGKSDLYKYLIILFLGGAQGLMGWVMVKSGLGDMPWVNPLKLMLHLILASILLVLTYRVGLERLYPQKIKLFSKGLLRMLNFLLILIFIQLCLGALVAGWKAAIPYPTWPKMGDEWIPSSLFALEPIWKNFTENKATIQFFHRTFAYITFLWIGFIVFFNKMKFANLKVRNKRYALLYVVSIQVALGIATLLFTKGNVPVFWGVLHQLVAFLLLLTVIHFRYFVKYR